jgi:hypothetical protein
MSLLVGHRSPRRSLEYKIEVRRIVNLCTSVSRIYFWTAIHHRFTSSTPNGALIATCRSCRRWRTNCVRISKGVKQISVREQPAYALFHTHGTVHCDLVCPRRGHQEAGLPTSFAAFNSHDSAGFRACTHRPSAKVLGAHAPIDNSVYAETSSRALGDNYIRALGGKR